MKSAETELITYYLEMTSPEQLRPARALADPFAVRRAQLAFPALNRFFYAEVGRAHSWTDRLRWTDEQWLAWLERPNMQTWIGYVHETPAAILSWKSSLACAMGKEKRVPRQPTQFNWSILVYCRPLLAGGWGARS